MNNVLCNRLQVMQHCYLQMIKSILMHMQTLYAMVYGKQNQSHLICRLSK